MTLAQIDRYQQQGGISLKLDPQALLDGNQSVPSLWQSVLEYERPVLLYSSDVPERVKMHQSWGAETVSRVLEQTMASLARRAVDAGFGAVIVAGGETSGAVVKELQYDAYEIGASSSARRTSYDTGGQARISPGAEIRELWR